MFMLTRYTLTKETSTLYYLVVLRFMEPNNLLLKGKSSPIISSF